MQTFLGVVASLSNLVGSYSLDHYIRAIGSEIALDDASYPVVKQTYKTGETEPKHNPSPLNY